jgi:hypothetical protein
MANFSARTLTRLGLLTLLLGAGCSSKGPALNDRVEGTVKLEGVPLAQVSIEFVPDEGPTGTSPGSSAVSDEQGHYTLMCDNQKPGAVLGKHRVSVRQGRTGGRSELDDLPAQPGKAGGGPARKSGPPVPEVYRDVVHTPLRVEITKDQHTYDLVLSRNPAPAK